MDYRRIPFNFTTTDPLKRQEELERRFGLPGNKSNMFVDFANPGAMGIRSDNSASNSPRLQHRVPIFMEGSSEPAKVSTDGQNVDAGRKPHVRVIPIEIEGADGSSKKHRWYSGSSDKGDGDASKPVETIKHSSQDSSPKAPRVCTIPIQIEGNGHVIKPKSPLKTQKVKSKESLKETKTNLNGCSASKVPKVSVQNIPKTSGEQESLEQITLKRIQNIEEKLKGYHADVEKFSGTNKEKQYRYLDEMLTRCMLELDEIDTIGLDTIRLARKAAVKKVQASLDLLESNVVKEASKQDKIAKQPLEAESSPDQVLITEDVGDTDIKDSVSIETRSDSEEVAKEHMEVEASSDPVLCTDIIDPLSQSSVGYSEESKQINEKVKTRDATTLSERECHSNLPCFLNETSNDSEKLNFELLKPVEITEIKSEVNQIITSEMEPLVEEPLSDSKGESPIDIDLDSCNCDNDLITSNFSTQICEIDSIPGLDDLKEDNGQNIAMEVTEISVFPVLETTSLSNSKQAVSESTIEKSNNSNDVSTISS